MCYEIYFWFYEMIIIAKGNRGGTKSLTMCNEMSLLSSVKSILLKSEDEKLLIGVSFGGKVISCDKMQIFLLVGD